LKAGGREKDVGDHEMDRRGVFGIQPERLGAARCLEDRIAGVPQGLRTHEKGCGIVVD
jgi:hypothetical protein